MLTNSDKFILTHMYYTYIANDTSDSDIFIVIFCNQWMERKMIEMAEVKSYIYMYIVYVIKEQHLWGLILICLILLNQFL